MTSAAVGAFCFGLVVGWITYRSLRRKEGVTALTDISTVIGAVGGAAVTALYKTEDLFGCYAVGLAIGFFVYLIVSAVIFKDDVTKWMGE